LEKENRRNLLIILAILIVAGSMQTSLVQIAPPWLSQWLGYVDWLLLVTVYVGLQRAPMRAMLTGMGAGLIHDLLSGGMAIGVSGLSYVLAAYVTWSICSQIVIDNLLVRFIAVATSSLLSTSVQLIFYGLLKISLPVLAGGRIIVAFYVLTLLIQLIASTLLYILLDRIFLKDDALRRRRNEAKRKRS